MEHPMSNVGTFDRIVRVMLGVTLIAIPLVAGWALWSGIVAAIGVVLLATAALSYCPIYALFGLGSKHGRAQ
jgi:hypothetical protein